jgi:L-seryl-tRNA(Ser) seleniumtransferase
MTTYESLGIRRLINANATLTKLGGSLMPPEVKQAMLDAAESFIDLHDLQRKVGERLAEITHNEAAFVSSGAAGGLALATAACITGTDSALINRLPYLDGLKNEVIVHHTHRNGYDYAVRQTGVRLVEIGTDAGTRLAELEAAINPRTAAFFWFQGIMTTPGDIPLAQVIEIAHARGVPVIVDAAAQLPPVSNLWTFTQLGADLAIFSGGKDLRGPQSSGLVVGRKDLIEAIRMHGNPNQAFGRPMKVGKEEMMGLLAAVERYLKLDHDARERYCEMAVECWCDGLNDLPGVTATRDFPNEACQPLPRAKVVFADRMGADVINALLAGDPAISVAAAGENGIYLNPMTLEPGQETIVLERLRELLRG